MLGARVWRAVAIALVAVGTSACSDDGMSADPPADLADQIQLPPGFRISIWADNIIRPRSLTMGDEGTVFAGSYFFTKGVTSPIYALRDDDGDGDADLVVEQYRGGDRVIVGDGDGGGGGHRNGDCVA